MNGEDERKVDSEQPQQTDRAADTEPSTAGTEHETTPSLEQAQQPVEEPSALDATTPARDEERHRLATWIKEYSSVLKKRIEDELGAVEKLIDTGPDQPPPHPESMDTLDAERLAKQQELQRLSTEFKDRLRHLITSAEEALRQVEENIAEYSRSGGSMLSGCPGGGGVSGGVCRPFTNEDRSTWQTTYHGGRTLRIMDTILPGTHDSGMDKDASYTNSYETCQDISPHHQLMNGIRVLDLRVEFKENAPINSHSRFSIYHDLNSGRTVGYDILEGVKMFRNHKPANGNPKKEIVILDFHQFKNFTDAAHKELHALIKNSLGAAIIPRWMNALTIEQIWNHGDYGVVIAYEDDRRDPLFWDGVKQKWIGENFPSTDKLKEFMDGIATYPKPYDELWSIQCAKYNKIPIATPDDFSDKIREWFYSEDQGSYIQKFYIINTDWSLRQRLVDNCIHANRIRAESMVSGVAIDVPQSEEHQINYTGRYLIVQVRNSHWTRKLRLPEGGYETCPLQIKSTADYSTELMLAGSDNPATSITLNKGDVVSFILRDKKWRMLGSN